MVSNETGWVKIEPNTAQMDSWRKYFDVQGWTPFCFVALRRGQVESIVMPAEWPEWFDKEYVAS